MECCYFLKYSIYLIILSLNILLCFFILYVLKNYILRKIIEKNLGKRKYFLILNLEKNIIFEYL